MERSAHQTIGADRQKRLVVRWFSFTCCEDSTILFTELLNDHLDEWKDMIELFACWTRCGLYRRGHFIRVAGE